MKMRVVSGWRSGIMLVGCQFMFIALLLAIGYNVVRYPVWDRTDPQRFEITAPVAPWLLSSAIGFGVTGVLLALGAYFTSPGWTPGARSGFAWSGLDAAVMFVVGLDTTGSGIATYLAAPSSPNRTFVLVAACTIGALSVPVALVWAALTLERRPPSDSTDDSHSDT